MRLIFSLVPLFLLLSSCGSPPRPPTVDESQKHPANAVVSVRLQVCEGELQNSRIAARKSARAADGAKSTAIRLATQQQALAAQALRVGERRNTVYSILFGFGDTHVALSQAESVRLIDDARAAPLIVLRGRTDGNHELLPKAGSPANALRLCGPIWYRVASSPLGSAPPGSRPGTTPPRTARKAVAGSIVGSRSSSTVPGGLGATRQAPSPCSYGRIRSGTDH